MRSSRSHHILAQPFARSILMAVCVVGVPGCMPSVDERIAQIESDIQPWLVVRGEPTPAVTLVERMEELGVPGASVAVINGGQIEWARGYGLADVEENTPVTSETLFQAASISKPVAAMAVLKLVGDGTLDLDQNVNEKLTSWQMPDNEFTTNGPVTLRGLLTHSAGTTVWGFPGYAITETAPSTMGVLDGEGNTDSIRVYKEPGESWRYSGGGYTVAQLLLADVTQRPFPTLMAETVLGPIGMSRSTYQQPLPQERWSEAASAYRSDGTKVEGNWHFYPEMAAAGLWTTPTDLAKFAMEIQRAHSGGDASVLSQDMVDRMLEPGMNDWGLGPVIEGDGLRFGHGGANAGFRAQLTAFIENGRGVAVMTNSDNGGRLAQEIVLTVAEVYGWPGIEPTVKTTVTLDPEEYRAITGTYQFTEFGAAVISFDDNRLWLQIGDDDELQEMLAESATEFFLRADGTPLEFVIEDGAVTAAVVAGSVRGTKQ